ncbi:MAG: PKD domain-containing protein [Bacteroidales bacterium]
MKKNYKKLLLIVVVIAASFGCKKDEPIPIPIANFTYTKSSQNAPSVVTFTNTSLNASSYSWNFGDGSTSNLDNPTHTFTQSGVFNITLNATGSGGTNTITQTINIDVAFTKAFIKKITILNLPFINSSGAGWDPSSGPDVYYKITDINNVILWALSTSNRNDDVTPSMLPISWVYPAPYWQIPDINEPIFIDLFDYETIGNDEYMGYCGGFKLSDYKTYPPSITVTANGITATLDIQWLP